MADQKHPCGVCDGVVLCHRLLRCKLCNKPTCPSCTVRKNSTGYFPDLGSDETLCKLCAWSCSINYCGRLVFRKPVLCVTFILPDGKRIASDRMSPQKWATKRYCHKCRKEVSVCEQHYAGAVGRCTGGTNDFCASWCCSSCIDPNTGTACPKHMTTCHGCKTPTATYFTIGCDAEDARSGPEWRCAGKPQPCERRYCSRRNGFYRPSFGYSVPYPKTCADERTAYDHCSPRKMLSSFQPIKCKLHMLDCIKCGGLTEGLRSLHRDMKMHVCKQCACHEATRVNAMCAAIPKVYAKAFPPELQRAVARYLLRPFKKQFYVAYNSSKRVYNPDLVLEGNTEDKTAADTA